MRTYMIYEDTMHRLEKAVKAINNKGGNATITRTGVVEFVKVGDRIHRKIEVIVSGGFTINGWRVIGKLVPGPKGNMITSMVDDFDYAAIPARITDAQDCICEHCNVLRMRKHFFVLRHTITGEHKLVGSDCLRDFTGGLSANNAAAAAEAYGLLEHDAPNTGDTFNMYSNPIIMLVKIMQMNSKYETCSYGYGPSLKKLRECYSKALEEININDRVKIVDASYVEWLLDDIEKLSKEYKRAITDVLKQPWACIEDWEHMRVFHKLKYYLNWWNNDEGIERNFVVSPNMWNTANGKPITSSHHKKWSPWSGQFVGDCVETKAVPLGTIVSSVDDVDRLYVGDFYTLASKSLGKTMLCYNTPSGLMATSNFSIASKKYTGTVLSGEIVDRRYLLNGVPYLVLEDVNLRSYHSPWYDTVSAVEKERFEGTRMAG